jgi:short-subunit dehydrogenase
MSGDHQAAARVALVTGASSGIGRATAVLLARVGWALARAARRAARLEELAGQIRAAGGEAAVFPTDLERPGAAASLLAGTLARFGRLDLLVNNAGWGYCAPLRDLPEEAARRMVDLNLVAPILLMTAALPHLRARRGTVINVSSGSGMVPSPYYGVYAATKAALISLGDSLRIEEHDAGLAVVSICPGPVTTEFGAASGGAPVHADRIGVRIETAEEVAARIVANVRRPGRTVPTSSATRFGWFVGRHVPRFTAWLVRRSWARRVGPEIEAFFEKSR